MRNGDRPGQPAVPVDGDQIRGVVLLNASLGEPLPRHGPVRLDANDRKVARELQAFHAVCQHRCDPGVLEYERAMPRGPSHVHVQAGETASKHSQGGSDERRGRKETQGDRAAGRQT